MNISEFIYTTVLKQAWIRKIVNKIILFILPKAVRVKNVKIIINPQDPVVSGALTFGVYEKNEIALMRQLCKLGKIVIDIGANVGLYTAIAGASVGASGRVIAFEPEPESFSFLKKTVKVNKLTNTHIVQAAASSKNGKARLFTSSANRGDHRMYPSTNADGNVEIQMLKLDDYLETQGVHAADIIKIDVQGFEGHVISGIEGTITRSPHLIMLMEFWPQGLRSAGTDPLKLLQQLENMNLEIFEFKNHKNFTRLLDKKDLIDRLSGRKYVNLVLFGPKAEWKP